MSIDVALVTWPNYPHRREGFSECVRRLKRHLSASRHTLNWHCTSETQDVDDAAREWLERACRTHEIEQWWRSGPAEQGANMNCALQHCSGSHILLVQDDMLLTGDLDLSPAADFLDQHSDFALVRFGWAYTEFTGPIGSFQEADRAGRYFYADEPHLRRGTFAQEFGFYTEGGPHGSVEGEMKSRLTNNRWRIAATMEPHFTHGGIKSSMSERWPENQPKVAHT